MIEFFQRILNRKNLFISTLSSTKGDISSLIHKRFFWLVYQTIQQKTSVFFFLNKNLTLNFVEITDNKFILLLSYCALPSNKFSISPLFNSFASSNGVLPHLSFTLKFKSTSSFKNSTIFI